MTQKFQIIGLVFMSLLISACVQQSNHKTKRASFSQPVEVVMISMPGSSASIKLNSLLHHIAHEYTNFSFVTVDVLLIPDDDPRLAYGAPTVLYKGEDILGEKPRSVDGLTSRVYKNVIPSEHQIINGIHRLIHQKASESEESPLTHSSE